MSDEQIEEMLKAMEALAKVTQSHSDSLKAITAHAQAQEVRLKFVDDMLKQQGPMVAAAVSRCQALAQMLVAKNVCTWDDLHAAEGRVLREMLESTSGAKVKEPDLEPIIKPN